MSRKRFIKLMMARGVSRNEAVALAHKDRAMYESYSHAYVDELIFGFPFEKALRRALDDLSEMLIALEKSVRRSQEEVYDAHGL